MKSFTAATAFIASASAFQGPALMFKATTKPAINMQLDITQEPGTEGWPAGGQKPSIGGTFWDPIEFTSERDQAQLRWIQESELKHGRVAMLAALGFVVGENFHPLWGGDINVPSFIAFQATPLQTFWPVVVAAIGFVELKSAPSIDTLGTSETRIPGDINFDPLGLKPKSPQEFKTMRTKEINNGRLAMLAIAGMVVQEVNTGGKLF